MALKVDPKMKARVMARLSPEQRELLEAVPERYHMSLLQAFVMSNQFPDEMCRRLIKRYSQNPAA
jgi:uncharacterized protein (DUF1778 family)